MTWKINAFIALLLAASIGAHSTWKQYQMMKMIIALHKRLGYYEEPLNDYLEEMRQDVEKQAREKRNQ